MTKEQTKAHELTTQLVLRYKNQMRILALLDHKDELHPVDDFQIYAATYAAALALTKNMSAKQ
jgi:hypothetical protein